MYRVILTNGKIVPFDNFSEALNFKWTNGGTLYVKVYGS